MAQNLLSLPVVERVEQVDAADAAPASGQGVRAWIGLGANLGDRGQAMQQALQRLNAVPGVAVERVSSLYASKPVDSDGPDYLNAVAQLVTRLSAHALLLVLQKLELDAGRERPYRNAPRTLDLDVLLYASPQTTIALPDLLVPHPRMWQRAFVLLPLQELQPAWVSDAQLQPLLEQGVARAEGPAWALPA